MKIRNGFISNSSSTSFVICFKGDETALHTLLKKYAVYFDLIFPYSEDMEADWKINVEDITTSIRECVQNYSEDDIYAVKIESVDDAIALQVKYREDTQRRHREDPHIYQLEDVWEEKYKEEKLKSAKKRGLTSTIKISFGDNHGSICGGRIGNTMDFEGRKIDINKEDFIFYPDYIH